MSLIERHERLCEIAMKFPGNAGCDLTNTPTGSVIDLIADCVDAVLSTPEYGLEERMKRCREEAAKAQEVAA